MIKYIISDPIFEQVTAFSLCFVHRKTRRKGLSMVRNEAKITENGAIIC